MLKEFKKFALRGNVIDLAVGVIIGGAFRRIVTALVDDIIMPVIGLFMGGRYLSNLTFTIGNAVIKWGDFLQAIIDFLIITIIVFLMVRGMNRLYKNVYLLTTRCQISNRRTEWDFIRFISSQRRS